MNKGYRVVGAVCLFLCMFVVSSAAGTIVILPDPFYYGYVAFQASSTPITQPGNYSAGPISATVNAVPNAGSTLSQACSFAATMPDACSGGAQVDLTYYYTVVGGNIGDTVPVSFNAKLTASAFSNDTGAEALNSAYASFFAGDSTNAFKKVLDGGCVGSCVWSQSWNSTVTLPFTVGDIGTVELLTQVSAFDSASGCPGPQCLSGAGSAYAYADPYIYIDPSTPNASLYSIVVSPGIGNVPLGSTPEPSSLMLLGTGVAGLAGVVRRKIKG